MVELLSPAGDIECLKYAIYAGCDAVLHCSGILSEMESVAKKIPSLSADARKRLQQGRALIK